MASNGNNRHLSWLLKRLRQHIGQLVTELAEDVVDRIDLAPDGVLQRLDPAHAVDPGAHLAIENIELSRTRQTVFSRIDEARVSSRSFRLLPRRHGHIEHARRPDGTDAGSVDRQRRLARVQVTASSSP